MRMRNFRCIQKIVDIVLLYLSSGRKLKLQVKFRCQSGKIFSRVPSKFSSIIADSDRHFTCPLILICQHRSLRSLLTIISCIKYFVKFRTGKLYTARFRSNKSPQCEAQLFCIIQLITGKKDIFRPFLQTVHCLNINGDPTAPDCGKDCKYSPLPANR